MHLCRKSNRCPKTLALYRIVRSFKKPHGLNSLGLKVQCMREIQFKMQMASSVGLLYLRLQPAGAARIVMTVHPCLCSRFCFHLHSDLP